MLNWDCFWYLYFWDFVKFVIIVVVDLIYGLLRVIYCFFNMGLELGVIVIFEMFNNIILKKKLYILYYKFNFNFWYLYNK